MYKKVLTLTCLLISSMSITAQQDTVTVKEEHDIPIFFRFDNSVIDFNYEKNSESIDEARKLAKDPTLVIDSIKMVAQASPEGSIKYNQKLANQRADALRAFFTTEFPQYSDRMTFGTKLYTWKELGIKIMHDDNVPELEKTLDVLYRDYDSRTIQRQLKRIAKGATYNYLEENYMKGMRSSANCMFTVQKMYAVEEAPEPEPVDTTPVYIEQIIKYPVFAFRTNLLLPFTNIGVEIPLGNRWSIAADWYTPWIFRTSSHTWAYQLQFANAEARYWFGEKHKPGKDNYWHRLTGHSMGLYVYGGKYDFQRGNADDWPGHQGEFFSVGLDYMYSLPIFSHAMRLEFEVAIGYFHNRALAYYVPMEGGNLVAYDADHRRSYFNYGGPTKVGVSLVLPLCKKYKKTIKLEAQK